MKTLTARSVGGPVNRVVSNPPYRKSGSGRLTPDSQKTLARHEIHVTLKVIEPKWLCMIHSGRKTSAKLMVIEGVKSGRSGIQIASPLIIYHEHGNYTPAVEKTFKA